ncbi:MAG: MaoC family dehydratase N-terminal domain-containing protein [Coriobacteriales bacterium]|nr:MaoC family dehydratase N-terminal domain-containing protein [Coriobacteriales bacterium]
MHDPTLNKDGLITPEALEAFKARIGLKLRVNNAFNDRVDLRSVQRFCDGIGEGNPLFTDPAYAAASVWGTLIAPPSYLMSVFPGWILQGLPGVHAFHSSFDFQFFQPLKEGMTITPESCFTGFHPVETKFKGKALIEHQTASYLDAQGQLIAQAKVNGLRVERQAIRDADHYHDLELPHPWTPEQLDDLGQRILAQHPRGSEPLYFQDLQLGDHLPTLIKGPLGATDIIAYCVGARPVHLLAHELALRHAASHPSWEVRDRDSRAVEPIFGVHYNLSAAQAVGMPYPYDIGSQRFCWQVQALTDWMGDAGQLLRCKVRFKEFVFLSDAVFLDGVVSKLFVDERGRHIARVSTTASNQRGTLVMDGFADVMLPSKEA